jgi:hypothetical protein
MGKPCPQWPWWSTYESLSNEFQGFSTNFIRALSRADQVKHNISFLSTRVPMVQVCFRLIMINLLLAGTSSSYLETSQENESADTQSSTTHALSSNDDHGTADEASAVLDSTYNLLIRVGEKQKAYYIYVDRTIIEVPKIRVETT